MYLATDDSLDLLLCVLGFSVKCFSSYGSWLKEFEAGDLTHPFLVVFSTGNWMVGLLLSGDFMQDFWASSVLTPDEERLSSPNKEVYIPKRVISSVVSFWMLKMIQIR